MEPTLGGGYAQAEEAKVCVGPGQLAMEHGLWIVTGPEESQPRALAPI